MTGGTILLTTHVLTEDETASVANAVRDAGYMPRVERDLPGDAIAQLLDEAADIEVLVTDELPRRPTKAPGLRWIQHTSTGLDRERASPLWGRPGLLLTSSSGLSAVTMAEHAIAAILYFEHAFDRLGGFRERREWSERRTMRPHPLLGRTVGILGFGGVGTRVAAVAQSLGMSVIAVRNDPGRPTEDLFAMGEPDPTAGAGGRALRVLGPDGLDELLRRADYLVIAAALTDTTRGLIGARELARLRPGATIVNVARAQIVDEAALIAGLRSGHLRAAALDVFDPEPLDPASPLFDLPNVLLSPHVSGAHDEMSPMLSALFRANLARYAAGERLYNLVRFDRGY